MCIGTAFLLWLNNTPFLHMQHFLYPFSSQWTVGLFPAFGYCEQCCSELSGINVCLNTYLYFFGYISRSEITGSCGGSGFNFLRNNQIVFHRRCPILHPTSNVRWSQFLHMVTNTNYFVCFILTILVGENWYLITVLICVSLMISGADRLLMCLLAIYSISSGPLPISSGSVVDDC